MESLHGTLRVTLTAKLLLYSQPCRICPKQSASANFDARVIKSAQTDWTLAPVRRTRGKWELAIAHTLGSNARVSCCWERRAGTTRPSHATFPL